MRAIKAIIIKREKIKKKIKKKKKKMKEVKKIKNLLLVVLQKMNQNHVPLLSQHQNLDLNHSLLQKILKNKKKILRIKK